VVRNIEQNTKHAVRATQVERQVEKKTYTHADTDSETGKQTRNVCEGCRGFSYFTPHSGVETLLPANDAFRSYVITPLRGIFREGQV